jgi:hypothetical protein
MENKFIEFLKQNNALEAFNDMVELRIKENNDIVDLLDYLSDQDPQDFVSSIYIWSQSKQGHIFWNILDNKWRKYIEYNETNN